MIRGKRNEHAIDGGLWLLCEFSPAFPCLYITSCKAEWWHKNPTVMGEVLFPCDATYLLLATYLSLPEIAPVTIRAEQLKQKFSSFLGSPSFPVLYSGRIFQRFQKASAAGKNRAQNYPVVLWVSSPWRQAQLWMLPLEKCSFCRDTTDSTRCCNANTD